MPTNYELYHHGVKGQKWGVRRYQPYPKGKHGRYLGPNSQTRKTFVGQSRYKTDVVLKKGDYLYRSDAHGKVDPEKKAIYVSLKEDHIGYLQASIDQSNMTLDLSSTNGNNGRPYSLKLQLKKDLIIPSYKKSVDTFLNTIKDIPLNEKDSAYLQAYMSVKDLGEDYVKQILSDGIVKYRDQEIKTLNGLKNVAYKEFVHDLFMDSDRRKKFFEDLEKQGYNAVVDENDYVAPSNEKSDIASPMIVFKKETMKQVGSRPLTKEDVRYVDATSGVYPDSVYPEDKKYRNDPTLKKRWNDWLEDRPKKKR